METRVYQCLYDYLISRYNSSTQPYVSWQDFFNLARRQGVLVLVWDVVSRLLSEEKISCEQIPRNIKLQWALSAEAVECRYEKQLTASERLAELWAEKGIQTIVMKGFAIGTYYTNPAHRESGDLDCFLTMASTPVSSDGYERGNQLCEQLGIMVSRGYYKDAKIHYRGLMVENHRFFLPIRGSRKMKALEKHLRSIALRGERRFISGTKLIKPSADFNALFLTAHGLGHFLSEGIKLRHILDWALLLRAEQNNIDWEEFYKWTDRMNMTRFADALTAISIEHLGLEITNPAIHTTSPYAERILHDTLYSSEGVFNKKASAWTKRLMLVRNKFSYGWKYHKIYQKSILVELTRSVFAFLFEKNPKL